jgi:hypothetical protein
MTDRELMQMALDALEYEGSLKRTQAIKALRNRLAQPERVHAIDISQERVDETVKREHEPYGYLWFAHQMERRFTHYRPKEEQRIGEVTPIYTAPPKREWVGLDGDIPGLGLVTEEFYNGMLCAEDILRKRNT